MSEQAPESPVENPSEGDEPKKSRRSKIITRSMRVIMEVVFAGVFFVAVVVGGLMWRLEQGPIPLDDVLPTVQSGLADVTPGLTYQIKKAALEPGNKWRAFNVRLYDVTVGNQEKQTIGSLEEMVLGFSWRNFLNLTFIPSIIEVQRPTVHVTRFQDGHIGFNLAMADQEEKPQAPMPELSRVMSKTLWALREIRVTNALLHYDDLKDPFSFDAKDGLFVLKRERNAISGTLSLNVKTEKFEQKIRGTIQYDPAKESTQFTVGLKDLPPDQLAAFLPQIPSEIQLKMPTNILLTATIDKAFMPVGVEMKITGKEGTLTYPPYYPEAIKLSDLFVSAYYNLLDNSFQVNEFYALLDKARLRAQASMKRPADPQQPTKIELLGLLEEFPVDGLKSYWPQGLATDARTWIVEHLYDGIVDRAGIEMHATLDKDQKFTIESLDGKIKFHGMTVDYLPPMLPVKNTSAEARYDLKNFDIAVEKGEVLDTVLEKAAINITDFDKEDQIITIDLDTKGPAADVISIISAKPLEYPQALGFNAGQFSGSSQTNVHLKFPLLNDLKLDQIEMVTRADLTDLTVKNAVKDLTVSGQKMQIEVDTDKLTLTGDAVLADAKAKVTWQEFFNDAAPYTTVLDLDGAITPDVLKGLRLPVDAYFKGAAATKAQVKQDQKNTTFVTVDAALDGATLTIPELRLEKKAGVGGHLRLDVEAREKGATTVSKLAASWPGFGVQDGTIRWNAQDQIDLATLKAVKVGRGTVDATIVPQGADALKATLRGDTIDLSGYWTAPKDPKAQATTDKRRYDLNLIARTLYLDPEIPLRNVQAAVSQQGDALLTANIVADTDQKGFIRLKQNDLPSGGRQLAIVAQNAGSVFQALDMTDTVQGGTLQVTGASTPAAPAIISGTAQLKNFTVIKAPVLARIINAFSPGGLIELLNNKGLVFSKMDSQFSLEKPSVIRLKNGRMTGTSIGMSFKGRVYRDTQTVNLSGTIVPVEGLNKIAGKIPVLGQILTGLKGEGLIAATYKVKGKTDNPDVTVNPLAVLAPGILRSIFFESNDD